jgi:hypothetical protein
MRNSGACSPPDVSAAAAPAEGKASTIPSSRARKLMSLGMILSEDRHPPPDHVEGKLFGIMPCRGHW